MSTRYTATINILKKDIEKSPELKKAVQDYFYNPDGELYDKDNWDDASPVAHFKDDEARDGEFHELEKLLIELKVPFDRWSSAYADGPVIAWYRPDINPEQPIYGDGELNEITVPASKLWDYAKGIDVTDGASLAVLGQQFRKLLYAIPVIRPLKEYNKD